MKNRFIFAGMCALALSIGACTTSNTTKTDTDTGTVSEDNSGNSGPFNDNTPRETVTPSGLRYMDIREGTGPMPKAGQRVTVHYVGTLESTGEKFDSSIDRDEPFVFTIGRSQVIKGWDEGVMTMRVGGKRRLIIPPDLAYGAKGAGNSIPPNSTLVFEVELMNIK